MKQGIDKLYETYVKKENLSDYEYEE